MNSTMRGWVKLAARSVFRVLLISLIWFENYACVDIQGGAVLRLDGGVRLTATYRLLSADLRFDSDIARADVGPGIAAPFVGVSVDF